MRSKNAFTLIELLAVVVIVGIIATIGVYSVMKIITDSRERALTNSALIIKRSISNYLDNDQSLVWVNNILTLDLTPGNNDDIARGANAGMVELTKDPWGKDYQNITALVTRVDGKYQIDLFIVTGSAGTYALANNSTEVEKVQFEFNPVTVANNVYPGEHVDISFSLNKAFGTPTIVSCELLNSSDQVVNSSYYTCEPVAGTNGNYEIPVILKKVGTYKFKITYTAAGQSNKIQITPDIIVDHDINIVMTTDYSIGQSQNVNIPFSVTGLGTIATIKDGSGNTLAGSPAFNTNYNIVKNYGTTGTKSESIVVTDNYGNEVTKNYTVNVYGSPTFGSITILPNETVSGSDYHYRESVEFVVNAGHNLPLNATVQRLNGAAWVNVTSKVITKGVTYKIKDNDILGDNILVQYPTTDNPYDEDCSVYGFRGSYKIIVSDSYFTITSPTQSLWAGTYQC